MKRKCNLLKLYTDMEWDFSSAGSCASLLTVMVKHNLIWQLVLCIRLVNDGKQTLIFKPHCSINADEVHFYLLYDYLSVLFLKSLQNLASCGGGDSIFPELDFKTNMPILKKEPSRDRDRQVGNFFLPTTASLTLIGHQGRRRYQHFVGFSVNFT